MLYARYWLIESQGITPKVNCKSGSPNLTLVDGAMASKFSEIGKLHLCSQPPGGRVSSETMSFPSHSSGAPSAEGAGSHLHGTHCCAVIQSR